VACDGQRDTLVVFVIVACVAGLLAGLFALARWGGCSIAVPDRSGAAGRMSVGDVTRRYVWWVTLAAVGGIGAGVFAAVGGAWSCAYWRRPHPMPVGGLPRLPKSSV